MATIFNFGYLKNLVLQKLQGDSYFSTSMIEDALNESQDDLAIFTKANLTSVALPLVVGQDIYPWPTGALIINGINFNGIELDEMTAEEWRRRGGLTQNNVATPLAPTAYAIQGKTIILYPKPGDSVPVCLAFYVPKPTDMVLDTDVPGVDRVHTKAWVHLACSNLLEMDAKRHDESEYHYKMYLAKRAENAVNENASRKRKFRNTYPRGVNL